MSNLRMRTNQLLSAVGVREKGFYTPYDYLDSVNWLTADYCAVRPMFAAAEGRFRSFLAQVDANEARFQAIRADDPLAPSWTSRFLPRLDAAAIYTFISANRPPRVIEVGCGNSTLFMARAIRDFGLSTRITCIDPAPRVPIDGLAVQFERRVLSPDDVPLFAELEPGDLVFIDSSHILQQGFDVDIILNRILPTLKPGVFLHFHDIFLPYAYPAHWRDMRFNEQCALMPWILSGITEVQFSSHYVLRAMPDDLAAICRGFPLNRPAVGGSLFLRKA
jgi:predicted O-methyltransferase YrrM